MAPRIALLSLLLILAGCDLPGVAGPTTTRPSTNPADNRPVTPGYTFHGGPVGPTDARPGIPAVLHLDVYLVDVPAESVSRDEAFWRNVDENAVGAAADQRLLRNGIRCGVAPRAQWRSFADIFSKELLRSRRSKVNGTTTQTVELDVDQPVDREDVWCLDAYGQWEGRTYEEATNGVALTFGPTPRVPGSARLTLCPIVKRQRNHLSFTAMNQPYDEPMADVVRLYDLGLTVDVPADGFFILAPGPLADPVDQTVGGRFLVRRAAGARREQVIVAVPSFLPLDGTPVDVAQH
jgi:hypothetical protein